MARRTELITIGAPGRDQGKVFLLREMAATQGERWAFRLMLAAGRSGAMIPDNVLNSGMEGLASISLRALVGIPFELAEPLLDEMMAQVSIMPDPRHPQVVRPLIEDDIEEIATRLKLREALLTLHTGFSLGDYLSSLTRAGSPPTEEPGPITATSQEPSPLSSPPASPPLPN